MFLKRIIKQLLPPALINLLLRLGFGGNKFQHGFSSFEEARKKSSGYDQGAILESIRAASAEVRDGKAAYERDGVTFDEIQYSWPLLSCLLATPAEGGRLRVLDFGGALGSSYRQTEAFLKKSGLTLDWVVLEQEELARIGQLEFANSELSFTSDFNNLDSGNFDVVLFASSICYIPNPEEIFRKTIELGPKRIIFDRTPEAPGDSKLYGIQQVGKSIYRASYPIISFGKGQIEMLLAPKYERLVSWVCDLQPDPKTTSVGHFFALRN